MELREQIKDLKDVIIMKDEKISGLEESMNVQIKSLEHFNAELIQNLKSWEGWLKDAPETWSEIYKRKTKGLNNGITRKSDDNISQVAV